jgi:dolichol-phosphate mannosyltransferase
LPEMSARADSARSREQTERPPTLNDVVDAPSVWVVLPTYNEAQNLEPIALAILAHLPTARLLVVDDNSPDGTGEIADSLASRNPRVSVLHRGQKNGLGRAYLDGFGIAIGQGANAIVQMDADFSHDPASLPSLIAPIMSGSADLVIGSRYVPGGGVLHWPLSRRLVSRAGSLFARLVLSIPVHDLTGGFKAWNARALSAIPFAGIRAGGYVFQIEMTHRAQRGGARISEVPITFRDRTVGVSKMSRRIVLEALLLVVTLRLEEVFKRDSAGSRLASVEDAGMAK